MIENLLGVDSVSFKRKWLVPLVISVFMLIATILLGPIDAILILLALSAIVASFNRRIRIILLIVLLPFAHAGVGIPSFGGFGVFDIFAGWAILLYILRISFVNLFEIRIHPLLVFSLIIPIFYLPGVLHSVDLLVTTKAFVQLIASCLTAIVVYDVLAVELDRRFHFMLLKLVVIEAAMVSLYGLHEAYTESSVLNILSGRILFSFFADVNYYAGYLLIAFALAIGFIGQRKGLIYKVLFTAVTFILAVAIIATVSRSGIIVMVFVVLAYSVYFFFQKGAQKLISIAVLFVFGSVIVLLFTTDIGSKFMDVFTLTQRIGTVLSGHDSSYDQRQIILRVGIRMIEDHPFIGSGFGTYESVFNEYKGEYLSAGSARAAHNTALRIFAETGIVGIVPSVIFLFSIFIIMTNGIRKIPDSSERIVFFGIIIALATFMIMSLTLDQLFEPHFWIILGLGLAIIQNFERNISNAYLTNEL